MHPSRCFDVCILRGALLHLVKTLPVFFGFVSGVGTRGVKCEEFFLRKTSPPFLALGSLVSPFRRFGVCAFGGRDSFR